MEIVYRKLQPGDAGSYRLVRLESLKNFPDSFGSTYAEESITPRLKFETLIEQSSVNSFMFGAFCEGQLIGITGFHRAERRKTRHRGEIVQVYVDPKYRGQKVGENLVRMVVENAFEIEGIEQLELSVVANNSSATSIYKKLGFEIYGEQVNYFKDGARYWDQQFMELFKEKYLEERAKRQRIMNGATTLG
jgi:RimJ/RimL family protein N-acetyltransferase